MGREKRKTDYLLSLIREGKSMTLKQQLRLTMYLSTPAIMAQVSSIAMQYIDASMVGSLGANAAASIGLVSTDYLLSLIREGKSMTLKQQPQQDFPYR